MRQAVKGLGAVLGLPGHRPGTPLIRPTLNGPDEWGPWLPPTPPPRAYDDTAADPTPLGIVWEVHHEEYGPAPSPPPTWAQAEALARWRRRMDAWLDHEWIEWQFTLAAYPAPDGAA